MPALLLDGLAASREVLDRVRVAAQALPGGAPRLAIFRVGDDPDAGHYLRAIQRGAKKAGVETEVRELPWTIGQDDLLAAVAAAGQDPRVDGVQVLKPLPGGVRAWELLRAVPSDKDVEGVNPENQGFLFMGSPRHIPCTAHAALMLLDHYRIDVAGMHAVVVGRSDTVGRPVSALLIHRNATVVVCHTKTRDLAAEVGRADLVVACAGRPELVRAEWIADGAVVVDIGYHVREDGEVVGDVEAAAAERAGALSPARGGVGPLTVTMLMANMLEAARLARGAE